MAHIIISQFLVFKEELFLCRDRFGIKPLYYLENNQSILFSSSIKAIKSFYEYELTVKEDDLLDFLQYGTVHQPNTILSNIKSVPRASFLVIGNQETKIIADSLKLPNPSSCANTWSLNNGSNFLNDGSCL